MFSIVNKGLKFVTTKAWLLCVIDFIFLFNEEE